MDIVKHRVRPSPNTPQLEPHSTRLRGPAYVDGQASIAPVERGALPQES